MITFVPKYQDGFMRILVTGASGFIGSFIVEEALRKGMDTWAAVRKTSSRQYLRDERIHLVELNLSDKEELKSQLVGHEFDYVVHAAGVTKCMHKEDFFKVNTEGTRHLVEVLLELNMPLKRFVYLSSLSVFGAVKERQPYEEITENDMPKPNTAYGKSKLETERYLDSVGNNFPYVILRPTGVYGPREKDYFLMAKSIRNHVDFSVGFRRQEITFVYVADVVQAVFLALNHGMTGRKYFLTDGGVYQSSAFSNLLRAAMGKPWWIRITAPLWLLRVVTSLAEYWGHATGKLSALNKDKYNILRQRNWRCDIEPAMDELGYHPRYDLERGVKLSVKWYQENNWL